jgi:Tol biopolymer transport system component
MHRRLRFVAVCLFLSVTFLAFAQKRSITEKDLFEFNWIGDPQVSPDGSRVAFVKVTVNDKKDGYDTSIWSVSMNGDESPVRLTTGNHDSAPRWSPDGKWLAFLRTSQSPDGVASAGSAAARPAAPQIYLMPMTGGESWRVTDLPRGAGPASWSPDGKTIAFLSSTSPEDLAKQRSREQKPKSSDKDKDKDGKKDGDAGNGHATEAASSPKTSASGDSEHESDVRVITRAVYRW